MPARERALSVPMEQVLAAAIARDLDAEPDDIRVILAANAVCTAFAAARNHRLGRSGRALGHAETLAVLEAAPTFLDGGLKALQRPAAL